MYFATHTQSIVLHNYIYVYIFRWYILDRMIILEITNKGNIRFKVFNAKFDYTFADEILKGYRFPDADINNRLNLLVADILKQSIRYEQVTVG